MEKFLIKRKCGDVEEKNKNNKFLGIKKQKTTADDTTSSKKGRGIIIITDKVTDSTDKQSESHASLQETFELSSNNEQKVNIYNWKALSGENLNVVHTMLYKHNEAKEILTRCENELSYFDEELAQVQIFGKWIQIPRKHVAHGDPGLTYTFSNNTIPARPWTALLTEVREVISRASGYDFNFVLINRYNGGSDYMGEHKDDEKDLCQDYPIASLSLGQARDFVFKHQDKKRGIRQIDPVSVQLKHGMLLLMHHPTNRFWYHSLPKRAAAHGVRVNMTFRRMDPSKCKPVSSCRKK